MGALYLIDMYYIKWNKEAYLTDKIAKTTSFDQPDINQEILLVVTSLKHWKIEVAYRHDKK